MCTKFGLEQSVQKDITPGPSEFFLASSAHFYFLTTKSAMLFRKVPESTKTVCIVPVLVSIMVPSMTVRASHCPSISLRLPIGLDQSSSSFVISPCCAYSSPLGRLSVRISLVGYDIGTASKLYPYRYSLLLRREKVGQRLVS